MDIFQTIERRRSIRKFSDTPVPESVIIEAMEAAILAPNSSNVQTWNFYWVKDPIKKEKLVEACLSQSAARTAQELIVAVASPQDWRRSQPKLSAWVKEIGAPKPVIYYYEKLVPAMYQWGYLNSLGWLKKISFFVIGLFRPMMRGPALKSEIQTVCIKSAALACQNFVLAISAQDFSSCMMEGFDEARVKTLLSLKFSERVVMVIGIGKETDHGTWGPRYRLPLKDVFHQV